MTPDRPDGEPTRFFRSKAARRDVIVRTLALLGLFAAVTVGVHTVEPRLFDPVWLRRRLAAFGAFAPYAFVALQALQVLLAPIPGQLLGGVGGYLFGVRAGTAYSLLGVCLGSAAAFALARRYGRPYVERVTRPETLARWDRFLARNGLVGLFVLFLLPTFPDDLLCFVAGISDLRLRTFLAFVVVGRAPSFLAASYAGDRLAGGHVGTFLAVVTALAVLSFVVFALRKRVVDGVGDPDPGE
ncbi:TVP38/TMEM64 family protein [Haloarcula sp. Atlit-7R]|uniref:TVP38/TMEM64 family protein n=1 Tax=Haloarcula sp. Atlit-7R TaxID=2282125 RepID=UPI000EF13862|nr:TVP38/TMEM64 family protein [Haloarcula sp. Atlit-7R]RLM96328.1 TVP38/TMEM64 family protein [Haloarcula sp. Atlit-7R]